MFLWPSDDGETKGEPRGGEWQVKLTHRETKAVIPFDTIVSIEKKSYMLVPNAIEVMALESVQGEMSVEKKVSKLLFV